MQGLQPLDIIVFDGQNKLLHSLIEWRGLDSAIHSVIAADSMGTLYDPDLKGIKKTNLLDYTGRTATIHRYNKEFNMELLREWCEKTYKESVGYDLSQWFYGFCLGIRTKDIADEPHKWTCAELPYWMFQENGYRITPKDEILPMPRLFRYNPYFTTIFEGVL